MSTDSSNKHEASAPAASAISPTKRRQLQQCFERANDLAHRDKPDHDYAHDLYSQCVVNDPGNLVYTEALLDNLQRKFKNNRKGSRLRGFGGRKAFTAALEDEDWSEVFREGVDLLRSNPWDVPTLRALAKACAANRYNEVELRYLKNALDAKPKDVEVNRHCAHSLARMGQFDMAIACWHRVSEATKGSEAEEMISELTLAKTMGAPVSAEAMGITGPRRTAPLSAAPPGEDREPADDEEKVDAEAGTSAESEVDPEPDPEDAERHVQIQLNERQKLERAIRDDPTKVENYIRLAELHSADRRYQDAEKILRRAMEAAGTSLELQTALEDAGIRASKARVAIAEKRAAREKSEEADELVTQLRADLNRLELDVYQQRCQRYPEKKRLHFDLGLRLRRAGNYLEAIKAHDIARKDPHCAVAATLEMGECWQQLKQYPKALKCYQVAIEKSSELDGDRRKLALFRGAVLATALKQTESAREWLSRLVGLDPHFKDAASRLDKLRSIGDDS